MWTVASVGMCIANFFFLKYIISYPAILMMICSHEGTFSSTASLYWWPKLTELMLPIHQSASLLCTSTQICGGPSTWGSTFTFTGNLYYNYFICTLTWCSCCHNGHNTLIRYVYTPLMTQQRGFRVKLGCSVLTFGFVAVFHGNKLVLGEFRILDSFHNNIQNILLIKYIQHFWFNIYLWY